MSDDAPPVEDFQYKPEFAAKLGISPRTVDQWVAKGKVERIVDLDRRALFRLVATPAAPTARQEPPPWAQEIIERQSRIEAKLDALAHALEGGALERARSEPVAALPEGDHPTPAAAQPERNRVTRPAWFKRLLFGE